MPNSTHAHSYEVMSAVASDDETIPEGWKWHSLEFIVSERNGVQLQIREGIRNL